MHGVTIRNRRDGIVEIAPTDARPDAADRLGVEGTVLLVSAGLFLCGKMPAPVLGAIAASSLAGEVVLAVKALALALLRPPAEIHEVGRGRARR
jgi:hypothetical protein